MVRKLIHNYGGWNKAALVRRVGVAWLVFCCGCGGVNSGGQAEQASPGSGYENLIGHLKNLPAIKSIERWEPPEFIAAPRDSGLIIQTGHYQIFSTLQDPLMLRRIPVFMESTFLAYSEVLEGPIQLDKKLTVYMFDNRGQWEEFTRFWTKEQAGNYLKIKSGAYYHNGACVNYNISRGSNFSILAHEGWHQFSDAVFKYRLPAWLDEGLATNFEAFQYEDGQYVFSAKYNASRLVALNSSLINDHMIPLADLLVLDAGRIISHTTFDTNGGQTDPAVLAYYSQLYAFIRFLREEGYGRRWQNLRKMLSDAYLGKWPLDEAERQEAVQRDRNPTRAWNAKVGKIIFQTYIAANPVEIESSYHGFCKTILAKVRFKKKL